MLMLPLGCQENGSWKDGGDLLARAQGDALVSVAARALEFLQDRAVVGLG